MGVDTHQQIHHAAVIDASGRHLDDAGFPASAPGYRDLLTWARSHGQICAVGVESTGSYGAGLTRYLLTEGLDLYEVTRPEKSTRVKHGKSDPVDAYTPPTRSAPAAPPRVPRSPPGSSKPYAPSRSPATVPSRPAPAAYLQLRDLITTAPTTIRADLLNLTGKQRVTRVIGWAP